MCCWVQQEPQLKEARKTEENSALVVSTGEGWSTVPNRLQCFDQQRQRCSLSRKREDQKFSWVRQEPQQRGAMRTEEKSVLVVTTVRDGDLYSRDCSASSSKDRDALKRGKLKKRVPWYLLRERAGVL